jgi:tetratricopeptide (TPR) repeat protein
VRGLLIALSVSVSLVGALSQAPAPPTAPSAGFVRLFNQYRTGDADAAVTEFASWDRARVDRESAIDLPADDLRAQAALALFHTEAGIRNGELDLVLNEGPMGDHLVREPHGTVAGALIDQIRPKVLASQNQSLIEFVRTWYIVQASVAGRWQHAFHLPLLTDTDLPPLARDPEWLLLRGAWIEKYVGPDNEGTARYSFSRDPIFLFGDSPSDALTTAHGVFDGKRVQEAESTFKTVLARDPTLVEARLRLGHLYALVNRRQDAERELEAAFAASEENASGHVFVHYLSALFLGGVFEEDGDLPRAERMYEAAIDADPDASSARVALTMLHLRDNQTADPWAAVRETMNRASSGAILADPVSLYPDGAFWQVPAKLRMLRSLVR